MIDSVSAITCDITERNRAEAALRLRSEVIHQAHEPIFAQDPTDSITFWKRVHWQEVKHDYPPRMGVRPTRYFGRPV